MRPTQAARGPGGRGKERLGAAHGAARIDNE
jgi:hypothetical protein